MLFGLSGRQKVSLVSVNASAASNAASAVINSQIIIQSPLSAGRYANL
jgi:hypothetical protein